MTIIEMRTCNLCSVKMDGGINGFIKHGEEFHTNFYIDLNGFQWHEKKYWCPLTNQWYFSRKHMARAINKCGWSDEAYYTYYGEDFMLEEWKTNTTDPVLGDARNKPECLWCGDRKCSFKMWEFSAFCGFSCSTKWYAKNTDRVERAQETNKQRLAEDPNHQLRPNQLQYWINKGHSEEEAKALQKTRQTTFTKDICIEKYGDDEGIKRWKKRQNDWLNSLKNSGIYVGVSEVSRELIAEVAKQVGGLTTEHTIRLGGKKWAKVDCYLPEKRKILEFYGDYWHGNPNLYGPDDVIKGWDDFMPVFERWEADKIRQQSLEDMNHKMMIVWEQDFLRNRTETIKRCVKFFCED